MDERTRLFLWVLTSTGCFGLLLALFGGITGLVTRRQGRAGGTALGLGVARAFGRMADRPLSPQAEGALVGAADGLVFGTAVGTAVGLFAGWHFPSEWQVLRPILVGAALLVAAALAFGLFASSVAAAGPRAVLGLFAGGMAGAFAGFALAGVAGLFVGVLAGAGGGALAVRPWR